MTHATPPATARRFDLPARGPALLHRFVAMLSVVAVALTLASAPAAAIDNLAKPASIVVDARSGKILYEHNSAAKRYPASVTKVMTLYVLFEELEARRLSLSSKMKVSTYAASARPTKLGLGAGKSISVEDAIKSLVTISANDMARVIAETISGSESAFAERMTTTARRLGMKDTRYANASGWPDPNNFTTVRDQAVLGIAIQQRFPQYYKYFQTRKFVFNGRTYTSHNHVLGYMGAVDGLKTGWTSSSGSTILTAARLEGREVVLAVFGYPGHAARDAKVRELVQAYLPKGARGGTPKPIPLAPAPREMDRPTVVAVVPMPRLDRSRLNSTIVTAALSEDPIAALLATETTALTAFAPEPAPQPVVSQPVVPLAPMDSTLGAPPSALGQTRASAPLEFMEPVEAQPAQPAVTQTASASASGNWVVQIGAAPTEANANELLGDAVEQIELLASYRRFVERFESKGSTYYRARLGGFASHDQAREACGQLEENGFPCLVTSS